MIVLRDAVPATQNEVVKNAAVIQPALSTEALPGGGTSILYKFGMSPMLWALAALAAGGGYFFYKKKVRR